MMAILSYKLKFCFIIVTLGCGSHENIPYWPSIVGCKNDKGHSSFDIHHRIYAQKLCHTGVHQRYQRQTSSWEKQDPLDFCLSFKDALMTLQKFRYTAKQARILLTNIIHLLDLSPTLLQLPFYFYNKSISLNVILIHFTVLVFASSRPRQKQDTE